ncbi:unnamed protein product [Orchesella dallaii]|uniref:Uncharacterized protein n=1 Tax=Orchesella dallaii TaxID=48710 RepID=A0ABP1S8J1_9HEXA
MKRFCSSTFSLPVPFINVYFIIILISVAVPYTSSASCDIYIYNSEKKLVDCVIYEKITESGVELDSELTTAFPKSIESIFEPDFPIDSYRSKDLVRTYRFLVVLVLIITMALILFQCYLKKLRLLPVFQLPHQKKKAKKHVAEEAAKPTIPSYSPYRVINVPMPTIGDSMVDKIRMEFGPPPPPYSTIHI